MTSQAADGPETAVASRRSKLTPEREQEFFDAVLEQIRECGYDSVTMEGVAATTRCSKSTLYRQWRTKPQFVAAALRARRSVRFAGIDTGTLAGDLREVARHAGEGHVLEGRLFQALGHAVVQDEELQAALRDALVEPEIEALRTMIDRGVARGEVPADIRRWSSSRRRSSASCGPARSWRARTRTRRTSSSSSRRPCYRRSASRETQAAVRGLDPDDDLIAPHRGDGGGATPAGWDSSGAERNPTRPTYVGAGMQGCGGAGDARSGVGRITRPDRCRRR